MQFNAVSLNERATIMGNKKEKNKENKFHRRDHHKFITECCKLWYHPPTVVEQQFS